MFNRYRRLRPTQRQCTDIKAVEGYNEAIACYDEYTLLHRLRFWDSDGNRRLIPLTDYELRALDMFYERPPEEFILLRKEELANMIKKSKAYQLCRDSSRYWRGRPKPPHLIAAWKAAAERRRKEKEENDKNNQRVSSMEEDD